MEALLLLIPVSVALAAGFTVVCVRAIRAGQFDDLESPKWRMLFDTQATPEAGAPGSKREKTQSGAGAPRSQMP